MPDELLMLALCDEVREEPVGDPREKRYKVSLLGVWWEWVSDHFPTTATFNIFTYWRKADAERLERASREIAIVVYGTPFRFAKPYQAIQGEFPGRIRIASGKGGVVLNPFVDVYSHVAKFDLNLPFPGNYELEFYIDGVLCHTHTFKARRVG